MIQSHDSGRSPKPDISFASEISTAALVRLLVAKGVLNIEELLAEEKDLRAHPAGKSQDREKPSRLRQFAARHKWSRRLTSFLFGWKWQKKSNRKNIEMHD
ncbi:hypothetical protein JW935_04860 [candidate division KSB1 bacterium]|nr:hypothetical protein [candidate division KSB1 bacterium]